MIPDLNSECEWGGADLMTVQMPDRGDTPHQHREIGILHDIVKAVGVHSGKQLHAAMRNRQDNRNIRLEPDLIDDDHLRTMIGYRLHEDPRLIRGGWGLDPSG
jgi:hypothetical protein